MPNRPPPKPPQNLKPDNRKNVRDPSQHPFAPAEGPEATERRRDVSGDANMRLPHEHDETADAEERAGDTDAVIEQAHEDAESDKVDTEQRNQAVEIFDRAKPAPRTRR